MEESFGDWLCLSLKNGRYNLTITGERGNNHEIIDNMNTPCFCGLVIKLLTYHQNCLFHFYDSGVFNIDQEGRQYKPRLIEWKFEAVDLFPNIELETLDKIVSMHNEVAHAERRYRASENMIPDRER
jgi:hypothetical protein